MKRWQTVATAVGIGLLWTAVLLWVCQIIANTPYPA